MQELDKIEEALKNEEFRKMLYEYMDEINDPKNRAENEAYLKQLESDGEAPTDLRLLHPKTGFAIEARMKPEHGNTKVYVNLVRDEYFGRPDVKQEGGKTGVKLPHAAGPGRYEHDVEGSNAGNAVEPPTDGAADLAAATKAGLVLTFDVCVHPEAIARSLGNSPVSARFRDLLCRVALEAVDNQLVRVGGTKKPINKGSDADGPLQRLDSKYKSLSVPCVGGTPAALAIRKSPEEIAKEKAEKAKPAATASAASSSSTTPAQSQPKQMQQQQQQAAAKPVQPAEPAKHGTVVKTNAARAGAADIKPSNGQPAQVTAPAASTTKPAAAPSPPPPVLQRDSQGVILRRPDVTFVHRGTFDVGEHAGRQSNQVASNRPREIVARVSMPGIAKAGMITCDVEETTLEITTEAVVDAADTSSSYRYAASVKLPYPVLKDDPRGSAKWDKKEAVLTLVLPVQPAQELRVTMMKEQEKGKSGAGVGGVHDNAQADEDDDGLVGSTMVQVVANPPSPPASSSSASGASKAADSDSHSRWIKSRPAAVTPSEPVKQSAPSAAPAETATPPPTANQATSPAAPQQQQQVTPSTATAAPVPPAGAEPPMRWRQANDVMTVIIDTAGIDKGSVRVQRARAAASSSAGTSNDIVVTFNATTQPASGPVVAAAGSDNAYAYTLRLKLERAVALPGGAGAAATTRWDVSDSNMVLVLAKAEAGVKWSALTRQDEGKADSTPATAAGTTGVPAPPSAPPAAAVPPSSAPASSAVPATAAQPASSTPASSSGHGGKAPKQDGGSDQDGVRVSAPSAPASKPEPASASKHVEQEDEQQQDVIYELGADGGFDLSKPAPSSSSSPKKAPVTSKAAPAASSASKTAPPPVTAASSPAAAPAAQQAPTTKCKSCGGWGKDLVQPSTGLCTHCDWQAATRKQQATTTAAAPPPASSPAPKSAQPAPASSSTPSAAAPSTASSASKPSASSSASKPPTSGLSQLLMELD